MLASLEPVPGRAVTYDSLTVYPLRITVPPGLSVPPAITLPPGARAPGPAGASAASLAPLTLAEALDQRAAVVREGPFPGQATVLVSNRSRDRALLLAAGEVLEGGRCDRIVARDVLVPPDTAGVPVAVCPVEEGRSGSGRASAASFRRSPGLAGAGLRGLALSQAGADQVRDLVRRELDIHGISSRSRSLADTFSSRGALAPVRRIVDLQVTQLLRALEDPEVVGFAVAAGRELLGVEAYGSHDLLARSSRRALEGYALEASTVARGGDPPVEAAVAAALSLVRAGTYFSGEAPGGGTEWGVVAGDEARDAVAYLGAGVSSEGSIVHLALLRLSAGAGGAGRDPRGLGGATGVPGAPGSRTGGGTGPGEGGGGSTPDDATTRGNPDSGKGAGGPSTEKPK